MLQLPIPLGCGIVKHATHSSVQFLWKPGLELDDRALAVVSLYEHFETLLRRHLLRFAIVMAAHCFEEDEGDEED